MTVVVMPDHPPYEGEPSSGPPVGPPSAPPEPAPPDEVEGDPAPSRALDRAALAAVTLLALVLNCWALSKNGLGNTYYAAATRSMTMSWRNFFFASFDPGGFISVDKPPVALWVEALSARIFGLSSLSILLPSALAGAGSVALLWATVRRRFGTIAATISAAVLAVTPINVAVNRLNLPEPFMILFLVGAAWAILRSFDTDHWARWLILAGALVGLAFNTKMLAAYIPGPALALAVVLGATGGVWPRVKRAAVFGVSTLLCSIPWMLIVDLWPASSRPYVGGSTNNTVRDLVFGYNGLGRVDGAGQGGGGGGGGGFGGGGAAGPGGVFGGSPGIGRLWNAAVGGQIAWLIPVAVLGAALAIWVHRHDRTRRAAVVLWAGWLLLFGVVFSYAQGTFHSYYTSAMAPGLAALIGIGGAAAIRLVRGHAAWVAVLAAGFAVTVALELDLIHREPSFYAWLGGVVVALVAGAGVVALFTASQPARRSVLMGALAVALTAVVLPPAAWAFSEAANPVLNATLPQAGPRGGVAGSTFGSDAFSGNAALASFLVSQRNGETWDLVVSSAMSASGLIAQEGISVMALGGFIGSDPAATVASFAADVDAGRVRFVEAGGGLTVGGGGLPGSFPGNLFPGGRAPGAGGFPGGGGSPGGFPGGGPPGGFTGGPGGSGRGGGFGGGTATQILAAVAEACTPVTSASTGGALPASYDGTLYDCAGQGAAILAAGG